MTPPLAGLLGVGGALVLLALPIGFVLWRDRQRDAYLKANATPLGALSYEKRGFLEVGSGTVEVALMAGALYLETNTRGRRGIVYAQLGAQVRVPLTPVETLQGLEVEETAVTFVLADRFRLRLRDLSTEQRERILRCLELPTVPAAEPGQEEVVSPGRT